ncbi:MAG: amino acid racemase [Candidatus Gracilibacteria bacterium]|nr:amino acid racemase [Candidatus Gracilibacteria bacterium]
MIKKQIIGVLGGMGPYASLRCYELILNESKKYSNGIKNNDFPHIFIDNIPVKELTNSLESINETILTVKNEYERLKNSGINIFIMSCNTMHLYYDKIFLDNNLCNLSLIDELAYKLVNDGYKKVGILGSINTIKSGLYSKTLIKHGIKSIVIENDFILEKINNIILKIIGGDFILCDFDKDLLIHCLELFRKKGATGIVLGCTELPIAFNNIKTDLVLYDPLILTIKRACEIYYNK